MKRREMLKAASAALLGLTAIPWGWAASAQPGRKKVLYFTRSGGFEHSVVHRTGGNLSHSERILTEMGDWAGFDVECSQDGTIFDRDLDRYDVIAFFTSGDLIASQGNGTPMTPAGKQRLLDAVAAGKGFVAFHSSTDSFHSKGPRGQSQTEIDPYIAMLGGEFVTHGPQQEASLIIASRFPGVDRIGCAEGIASTDEWYAQKNFAKDLHVILVQETKLMKGECYQRPDYPNTWARWHGKGRVFYTAMGHREDTWTNPFFQAITLGGIAWALGNVPAGAEPNLAQATPNANQLNH